MQLVIGETIPFLLPRFLNLDMLLGIVKLFVEKWYFHSHPVPLWETFESLLFFLPLHQGGLSSEFQACPSAPGSTRLVFDFVSKPSLHQYLDIWKLLIAHVSSHFVILRSMQYTHQFWQSVKELSDLDSLYFQSCYPTPALLRYLMCNLCAKVLEDTHLLLLQLLWPSPPAK